jgi:hypothetical protein
MHDQTMRSVQRSKTNVLYARRQQLSRQSSVTPIATCTDGHQTALSWRPGVPRDTPSHQ